MSYGRTGPHVVIGDYSYRLDESPPPGLPTYRRWSRSLFSGRTDITGRPGTQNLNPDVMLWQITDFSGEGQKVLASDDAASATRFYTSEGLNFHTPGQFDLNPAMVLNTNAIGGGSASSIEGNAFANVTGTSTVVNTTDRRLDDAGTSVIQSAAYAPGAGSTEVSFFAYVQSAADQITTVQGSSFKLVNGEGGVQSTDFKLRGTGSRCQSPNLSLTTGLATTVDFYAFLTDAVTGKNQPVITCKIVDVTDNDLNHITASGDIALSSTSTAVVATLHFRPKSGHTYRAIVTYVTEPKNYAGGVRVDKITTAVSHTNSTVTVSVYNETTAAVVTSKQVSLASSDSTRIADINFTSAAATDYRFRVAYDSGTFKPVLDKVDYLADTAPSPAIDIDILERGQGNKCWAVSTTSGQTPRYREYNFTTNVWTTANILNGPTVDTAMAMAHTDAYEYVLLTLATGSVGYQVYEFKTGTLQQLTSGAGYGAAYGMCITQDRVAVLYDTSAYIALNIYALDTTNASPLSTNTITNARETFDATIKQRMVGTSSGARFFLNLGGTATIWESDLSGGDVVSSILAELDKGAKATCITHAGGVTFVGGQFVSETGQTAKSCVWVIRQDGSLERLGFLRYDDPDPNPPAWMEVWESDLYVLQGKYIWRYSLQTGGWFLVHELPVTAASKARALAAFRSHVFAGYEDEGPWISGWVGTYRTAGPATMNQFVSSTYNFGLPTEDKMLTAVELSTETLPTGTEVKVEIQTDESGTWTHLGTASTVGESKFVFKATTFVDPIIFNAISVRITPLSLNGTATPTVTGITLKALPVAQEEFFDLSLLCTDEDSADHADGQQLEGSTLAGNVWNLRTTGLAAFRDAYASKRPGDVETHLVRVETVDQQNGAQGEGRVFVRLRVMD